MATTDSSVLMALSELSKMEDARIADERARAAKAAREAEEKAAREAEAKRLEAARAAAAEAERQARVAAEATARVTAELEHERRLMAMRAELEAIRSERERMHTALSDRLAAPAEAPRRSGLVVALGLSSSIAAALAALLVVQATAARTPVRADATPPAPEHVAVATPVEPDVIDEVEVAADVVAAAPVEETPVVVAAHEGGRGGRGDRVRPPRHDETPEHHETHGVITGLHGLDEGDGMLPTEHR